MKSMQTETRTTTEYYVQWLDEKGQFGVKGAWVTPTDDLNYGGYEDVRDARTKGVEACFPGFPVDKRPPYRIVQRLTIETVITETAAAEPKYVLWPGSAGTSGVIDTGALRALAGYVRQRDE